MSASRRAARPRAVEARGSCTRARRSSGLARALLMTALLAGCREVKCEDLEPVPVAGEYLGGGSLGKDRLLGVSLSAKGKDVELRFTGKDGSKIRAKYKVTKKLKMKP